MGSRATAKLGAAEEKTIAAGKNAVDVAYAESAPLESLVHWGATLHYEHRFAVAAVVVAVEVAVLVYTVAAAGTAAAALWYPFCLRILLLHLRLQSFEAVAVVVVDVVVVGCRRQRRFSCPFSV